MFPEQFPIGTLAMQASVNVETIRFYQRKGLLAEPERPLAASDSTVPTTSPGSSSSQPPNVLGSAWMRSSSCSGWTTALTAGSSRPSHCAPRRRAFPLAGLAAHGIRQAVAIGDGLQPPARQGVVPIDCGVALMCTEAVPLQTGYLVPSNAFVRSKCHIVRI